MVVFSKNQPLDSLFSPHVRPEGRTCKYPVDEDLIQRHNTEWINLISARRTPEI
jgi:hypothetical protein